LFELTIILFELTNSPAMFQIMINEILQDLINTEEVVSFIDNIIVGIEEEKEYDRIVSQIRYSLVVIFELNSVPGV